MISRLFPSRTVPAHNPDYPASEAQIEGEWARLARTARPDLLPRPLVILAGYRSPAAQVIGLARDLRELTGAPAERVLGLHYLRAGDHLDVIRRAVEGARARFADAELDVVGVSMGGLIARAAALGFPDHHGRRLPALNIGRLFALGTPHRGADMARLVRPDAAAHAMRTGSAFLRRLDEALPTARYELVCYARLRDRWVGTANCAPPGRVPIWTPGLRLGTHFSLTRDRRILVDLARRLRGEEPWARPGQRLP